MIRTPMGMPFYRKTAPKPVAPVIGSTQTTQTSPAQPTDLLTLRKARARVSRKGSYAL